MEEYANEIIQEEEIYSNPEFQKGFLKGFKKAEKEWLGKMAAKMCV